MTNDISIGIATWNAEKFISETLAAARSQGYPLVVVDNTSTDGTRDVLAAAGLRCSIFEHTSYKWENVYKAYKTLAKEIKSEFCFILDHDVLLPKGAVDAAYEHLIGDTTLGAVAINYGGSHPNMGATIFRTAILRGFDWVANLQSPKCSCLYAAEQLAALGLKMVELPGMKAEHVKNGKAPEIKQRSTCSDEFQITQLVTKTVKLGELQTKILNLRRDLAEAVNLRDRLLGKSKAMVTSIGGVK